MISLLLDLASEKAVIGNFDKNILPFTNKSTQILDDFTKKM